MAPSASLAIGESVTHLLELFPMSPDCTLADGSIDPTWNPAPDGFINSVAISGSTVYVGGKVTSVSGVQRRGVAEFVMNTPSEISEWQFLD